LNEAALLAARKGRTAVIEADVAEACDKVRYRKERRSLELDMNEKKQQPTMSRDTLLWH
jgi:cell division protease FtsH